MKNFEHRNYNGKIFRPKPEVLEEYENKLIIVATPWGPRSAAESALKCVQDYYFSARGDRDSTSPFEFLDCLSAHGNDLRVSVMLANDKIYQDDNTEEYSSGTELVVFAEHQSELTWIQVGHPGLFLVRPNQGIMPIGVNIDLAKDVYSGRELNTPLPSSLLGVYEKSNFSVHSIAPKEDDKVVLISRSYIPKSFYNLDPKDITLDVIVHTMCEDDSENPFWAGIISF